ncbi:MAG TPA: RsiV family protein [Moraxellaceae bacterium]
MRSQLATLSVLCLFLSLAACQKEKPVPAPAAVAEPPAPAPVVVQPFLPLKVEKLQWSRQQPGCKVGKPAKSSRNKESSKACATAKADFLRFPDNPELSALLEKQLVTLAAGDTLSPASATVSDYADHYLKKAGRQYEAVFKATLLRQAGPLVLLKLEVYEFTGGANGAASTRYLNYDRAGKRQLLLDDVVIDGQRPALSAKLRAAHAAWNAQQGLGGDWAFQETDNFALDTDGLRFKYAAYAIAPRVLGEPEFLLPYAELAGVLRPEWILQAP